MKRWSEQRLSLLFRNVLVQNALSLYGVQFAGYIIPLVTIPYLARVLGAAGWGLVAFAQSFGSYVAVVGEYGFGFSATREVARHREDRERLTEILAGVLGAKTLLAGVGVAAAFLVLWLVPLFRQHPLLLWSAIFWALAQAFSMMWFFLGLERMRLFASLDMATKGLATIAIFLFVRRPGDEWRVLALQGAGFCLSFVICSWLVYRDLPFHLPTWHATWEAIHMGWTMFLFRGSVSLCTVGNVFVLGLFVSPRLVGFYAGAEKISKAFLGLLSPINQTLYPRMSHLVQHARERAARIARVGVAIMGGGGAAMGVLVFFLAPQLVRVILGTGYAPAVPVLRILALLPPLIGLSNLFGVQWMLPLGMDRQFNWIVLGAASLNLGIAITLAPIWGPVGMAWAVVSAELFASLSIFILLRIQGLDPFRYRGPVCEAAAVPVLTGAVSSVDFVDSDRIRCRAPKR